MALFTVPTLAERITAVRQRLLAYNRNISTLPGSVAGDLFVLPQAESDVQQLALAYYVSISQSVTELLALKTQSTTLALIAAALNTTTDAILADISTSLTAIGTNFSVTRLTPTQAAGTVTYFRVDAPLTDITIPAGKTVRASDGSTFVTTSDVTMYAGVAASYYNTSFGAYALSVPVQAVIAGTDGNAPAYTVTTIVTPVSGFTEVRNLSVMSGGRDEETDEAFGARILARWQGVGKTTKAGLGASIQENLTGVDTYIASSGDALSVRGIGRTDIYVKGVVSEPVTETFSAFNSPLYADGIRPTYQPVTEILSVSSGAAFLQKDDSTALAGSVRAQDALRFSTPFAGSVTVTYNYNRTVGDAQNVFNDPANAPANQQNPTTDTIGLETPILAKEASALDVDYLVSITVLPGYLRANVLNAVVTALTTYSDSLLLGQTVYLADVNEIVEAVEGVLRLTGAPTKFSPSNESGVTNYITPASNQYVRFLTLGIS